MKRIAPRTGTAIELSKGQVLTVIDPEGGQVSDLLTVSRADPREILSNGRTFDYEERIILTTGARLWSNRSNPMLTILEDTALQSSIWLPEDLPTLPISQARERRSRQDSDWWW